MCKLKLLIIVVLSIVVGIIGFWQSRYDAATLVLLVKTFEKGERSIYVADGNSRKIREVTFVLGDSEGADSFYAMELPRVRLETIRIPPLAPDGRYQIDGIKLVSSTVKYSWDNEMVCTAQQISGANAEKKICDGDAPAISSETDSSIIISLPADNFVNPFGKRVAVALGLALVVLFSCSFLLKAGPWIPFSSGYAVRAAWLAVILLYGFQLYLIADYAVDIPYWEEWLFFDSAALPAGLSWQWLTSQLSHQRMMAFTKLMAWINYKLFSLDFVWLKIMNYAVFGGILLAVARFNHKVQRESFKYFPLFMIFLLSPIVSEVHAASFQSGETAVVLFSVLMLNYLVGVESSLKSTLIFCACALAALSSLSAGFVYVIVFLACGTIFSFLAAAGSKEPWPGWKNLLLAWIILGTGMVFWLIDFKKPEAVWGVPEWLLPFEIKFWDKYLNLLSYAFGFELESPLPGIVCLVIVLAPLILLMLDKDRRRDTATWQVGTAIMGTLAVIGLLVVGRGNMPIGIKVSRYVIFGYLLIPYTAIAWWLALQKSRQRAAALTLLWCFCAAAYWNNWDFRVYRDVRQHELFNLECVAEYSHAGGEGMCSGTYLFPIGKFFDSAKKLDIHFTRQFKAPSDKTH